MQLQWLREYRRGWKILKQHYHTPYRMMLVLGLVVVAVTLVGVYLPYLMKQIIDLSQLDRVELSFNQLWSWQNLYLLAIAYALGWFLSNFLDHLTGLFSGLFMVNIESSLVYKGLENYFHLKYSEQKKIDTGVINTDIWRGASAFSQLTYTTLFILTPVVFEILVMMWMLAQNISFSFSFYFLLFALLTFALTLLVTFKSQDVFTAMYEAKNMINQFFIERVQSHYDVQVNAAHQYELKRFAEKTAQYRHTTADSYYKIVRLMIIQIVFVGIFLLSFMILTVYLFEQQQVTTGDFVLISAYIIGLTMPILRVSQSLIRLRGDYIALQKFNAYFSLPQQQFKHDQIQAHELIYQFHHAQFQLGKYQIRDFNLSIEQGKCYVIMGQTGIGETSFIQYLIGLEQIDAGQLLYKNIDISAEFAQEIYTEIAVVSQTPIVYSGSLRENLVHNSAYTYTDAELEAYLVQFNLLHLLQKNKLGLDDDIQEIYKSFSGGEKQRISIIRALLKQPQCLIMDEPTAAINEEMGRELLNMIHAQVKTIIMITHAHYAQQFADELIDFDALIATQHAHQNQDTDISKV